MQFYVKISSDKAKKYNPRKPVTTEMVVIGLNGRIYIIPVTKIQHSYNIQRPSGQRIRGNDGVVI
jgi:hypothetical protein